jgi:hypothetical protein
MKAITTSIFVFLLFIGFAFGQQIERKVVRKTLISNQLPKIKVQLLENFKFVGKFDFTIRDIAKGERYVFVDARKGKIQRLFIAQFEAIFPESDESYRYNFDNAQKFSEHKFRQNTFAFSNIEARKENPTGEAALTEKFLQEKGYMLGDELMMSRFVTVPDKAKKHELILFYIENVSSTKHKLNEFYKGNDETEIWRQISQELTSRSLKAFKIY